MTTHSLWLPADWPAPPGVVAGCTFRHGGVSTGTYASLNLGDHVGDAAAAVRENRRRFVADTGMSGEPAWLAQVHGARVVVDPLPGIEADAALSRQAGAACVVLVADCLPVLFCTEDGSAVAAAHAGWRGLAAGVLENTVEAFGAGRQGLLAWLGPAISQAAYEVGAEVREAFISHDRQADAYFRENARGRWQADLAGLARQRLEAAGVARVSDAAYCTYTDPARFFSYRRDGQCGRLAAFVFRHARALEKG